MPGCAHFPSRVVLLSEADIQNAPVELIPAALCGVSRNSKRIQPWLQTHSWNEKRECLLAALRCGHRDSLCPELLSLRILERESERRVRRRCIGNIDQEHG